MANKSLKIRLTALMCMAAVLVGTIAAFWSTGTLTVSGSGEEKTEFDTYAESSMTETKTLNSGDAVEVQFHTLAPTVSFSIVPESGDSGCEFTVELFRWDDNIKKTLRGSVLHKWTVSEWAETGGIYIDFTVLSGGALEAGEYVLRFRLDNGSGVVLKRYRPSVRGINCFENEYHVYGSYIGKIVSKDPVDKLLTFHSPEANIEYHTAPPEWTVPEDSAIAQMDVDPTQWTAVDGLGRTLPDYSSVGGNKERKVGMFYWTWHYAWMRAVPCSVTEVIKGHPDAINDFDHEIWKQNGSGYFWDEPLFGYYTEYDDYVLRKHAEMLADAGVDFVLFDCTNDDATWEPGYMNLLKVWSEARADGIKTPQVAFMLNFVWSPTATVSSLRQIYEKIYKDGKYQDLWFYWEGKPLVMSHNGLDPEDTYQAELSNFFTFKAGMGSYFGGDMDDGWWGWLHVYPQSVYRNPDGSAEYTTVGVSQNADYETMTLSAMNGEHIMGRSFSMQPDYSYSYLYAGKKIVCSSDMDDAILYGINFQEQWDYALKVDPEIIFVTGWNEWNAGRSVEWCGVPNAFPDEFTDEYSRDVEPTRGRLKDHYYYQLVANIRRYKGVSKYNAQQKTLTIDVGGDPSQWDDPSIVTYNHYTNNTYERDIDGWATTHYTNSGTRNDIKTAKVSYDSKNVYFYVETVDPITSSGDENWMRLLLDTGEATKDHTDWEGFEYILNRVSPASDGLVLERSTGGWNWEEVGHVDYSVSGNVLQVAVPRKLLGFGSGRLDFNFKWCDANLADGDILTLYTDGDAAPGGRFCFHFTTKTRTPAESRRLTVITVCSAAVVLAVAAVVTLIVIKKKKGKKVGAEAA
ncbi:MAG: hypothetical protein J5950_03305 [Clostridia bacterium]|nr:hypothetical protein [Clostridia bacterium]